MPRTRRISQPFPEGSTLLEMRRVDSMFYPPRGLSHEEAARYIGLGVSKFDELVATGLMPQPRMVVNRRIWDRVELDMAFSELPKRAAFTAEDMVEKLLQETREKP